MAESPWPTIHAERDALANDLAGLTDEQWATPSLCDGWNVREVLAHVTGAANMTPPAFFGKMLAAGFRFPVFANKEIARQIGASPAETLSNFKASISSTKHPPGPIDTWLGETLVHAEDIRRPLGITHAYPPDAVKRVADFYKGSNLLIGSKKRIAGLTLRATDTDWTTGSGPEVSGPAIALVMAMTGRRAALDDLEGEGKATLASRF
jgi:uncharacterized protein (TIGR03083 family)